MSRVKNKNTTPEKIVRTFLFSQGFRFRLHSSKLPGKPDLVLPKYKTVIFINGCFWHGHAECSHAKLPTTNFEFWQTKLNKNKERDRLNYTLLQQAGWQVLVVWQCQLKKSIRQQTLFALKDQLLSSI